LKKHIIISLLLILISISYVKADMVTIKVLPIGINMTFKGNITTIVNKSMNCNEFQQLALKLYIQDEYQDLLKPYKCEMINNSITLLYNFTNIKVNSDNLYSLVTTPKIYLKENVFIVIPEQITFDGKIYKIYNKNDAKTYIGKLVPSVTFYEFTRLLNNSIYIRVVTSDIIYIVSTNKIDIEATNKITTSTIVEDNIKYYVYKTTYNESGFVKINKKGIYIVNVPYSCYDIKQENGYLIIKKTGTCQQDSQLTTSKTDVVLGVCIGDRKCYETNTTIDRNNKMNLIYIGIGIVILLIVLIIYARRE